VAAQAAPVKENSAPPNALPPTTAPAPPAAQSPAASANPQPPATARIVLQVKTMGQPAWISITADGLQVWEATLPPGEQQTITANDSVSVITGNAGVTEIVLNGQPQASLGPVGTVAKFVYPPPSKPANFKPSSGPISESHPRTETTAPQFGRAARDRSDLNRLSSHPQSEPRTSDLP
jgi:hypothetical protein